MLSEKLQMFQNRLTKVYKHRSKIAARRAIGCYRVYENDLPEFPLSIDCYEDKLYVSEYVRRHGLTDEEHALWLAQSIAVISKVMAIEQRKIYVKQRKKMSHRLSNAQYEKQDAAKQFHTVTEGGHKFLINLSDYLDTGLFLDHRLTRQMVKEESAAKRVLNLFCYTGSFSVYAASGGATSVTSVDLSKPYLQWAEDNFRINLLKDEQAFQFIHADVMQYIQTLKPNSFDLIVLDPPTFSNSKRMDDFMEIQKDHVDLINNCLYSLSNGGTLYFSTNFTKFILEADKIKATSIKDITRATTDFDFEGKLKRWCYKISK